jgi:hypothetical protein
MAKRANSKAAKIRALLAERPDISVKEVVKSLSARRVRVTPAQVYNLKSESRNGRVKAGKAKGYEFLFQAKKLVDAMGGVDKARATLDMLAKLL